MIGIVNYIIIIIISKCIADYVVHISAVSIQSSEAFHWNF